MTRDEFREAVFARDNHKCVYCGDPAADAHHLIERRLWPDGGYHLDNGVSLCEVCHLSAEMTIIPVEILRGRAGITKVLLPKTLEDDHVYDKWGNIILPDGKRMRGPLFYDESVQKVLSEKLDDFVTYVKYPRTPHLPWSMGVTKDDMQIHGAPFRSTEQVVVTEKMDGENTTMYRDYLHSRSLDSGYHESRTWVKNFWSKNIAFQIPEDMRIVGENMYAVHSLKYDDLKSYFYGISIWEDDVCLDWDTTMEYFAILGITPVPVLARGRYEDLHYGVGFDTSKSEGYVIRKTSSFRLQDFQKSVAKYVRPNHVTTLTHWKSSQVETNDLA